ncbi:MAG TPA: hypothetical protein VFP87_01420 [Chitinophagaceae bacterium]|nr:hypothetical protein [Chitinophagaceae bacterium]
MKNQIGLIAIMLCISCNSTIGNKEMKSTKMSLEGTWKLLTGTLIEKGDTVVTDYTKGKEFIKIINDSHFAFLSHDLSKGKNADSMFSAGGGNYSLKDSLYTEHLEYCNDRQWEGNDFHFIVNIKQDTLVQKGVEKIDSLGVNRMNIERYVRIKNQN